MFQALCRALCPFHARPGCALTRRPRRRPQSGCLCGTEVMAAAREEPVRPSALICDGLFPQSSCCNNIYFVQRPRERERGSARASEHEPTPFQTVSDKIWHSWF